ncbi:MAG: aminotransferase class IV, partial [Spirochaetia bacterium]|nr:aminotransferase class IV [Spirochaetia bacterium]
HDSDPDSEYEECLLKARFLTDQEPWASNRQEETPENDFQILETFLWKEGAFEGLDAHLDRMADSAAYFDFPFERNKAVAALQEKSGMNAAKASDPNAFRVRLLLSRSGDFSVETRAWALSADLPHIPAKIRIASESVDSRNIFLFHKTTRRAFYERHRQEAEKASLADFLFLNERGEVTEGTIHNFFLKRNGVLWTPSLDCGLLPGIFRARLLGSGEAREKVIFPEDLQGADELFIGNSVRGLQKAELVRADQKSGLIRK